MDIARVTTVFLLLALLAACDHPIDIIGEGDVLSATGTRNCYLEDFTAGNDNCTKNTVEGAYHETYYAVARPGWQFSRWQNYCGDIAGNECSFAISAELVHKNAGATVPSLIAVFTPVSNEVPGVLSGDTTLEGILISCDSVYSNRLQQTSHCPAVGARLQFVVQVSQHGLQVNIPDSGRNGKQYFGFYEGSGSEWHFLGSSSAEYFVHLQVDPRNNAWTMVYYLKLDLITKVKVTMSGRFE